MILRIFIFMLLFICSFSCSNSNGPNKNKKNIQSEAKDFLFAGMINKKPGLFKYNFNDKNIEQFWSDKNDKVIELSYSQNRKNVCFISAEDYGISGHLPFIKNVKVYIVNPETGKAVLIEEIESGLQVSTQWKDENNFKVIINSFDKKVTNFINRRIMLFNSYGKKLEDRTEIFDLIKQGYPQLPEKKISYSSPENEYLIEIKEIDSISVFLNKDETRELIIKINQKIKQIEWTDSLIVFSSVYIRPDNESLYLETPERSKLIIYSLAEKRILKTWNEGGIENFFLIKDIIVFDAGFENDSRIIIYNFRYQKIIDEIRIEGGCGLNRISQILDFGV